MKNKTLTFYTLLVLLIVTQSIFSQTKKDSVSLTKRLVLTTSSIAGLSTAGFVGLHELWYKDYQTSTFHFFNDSKSWMQMDKIGHFYTANKLSLAFSSAYEWCGISPEKSAIIGASLGLGFQTTLEVMDGYSSEWGFSWSDMAANTIGSLSFLSQQLIWQEEKIILKFSYHSTKYAAIRPSVLGNTFSERFLKDYNGQTYWLSYSPHDFIEEIPSWLCVSLGYSIDAKLVGDTDFYTDPTTNNNYTASRQYLLSLDIDFSKLPIKRPLLKKIIKQFNYLKIPFPALIMQNGGGSFRGIYF